MKDKELDKAVTRFLNEARASQMLDQQPQPQPTFSFSSSTTPDLDVDKLNDVLNNMRNRIITLEKENKRLTGIVQAIENQLRGAGSGGWRRAWGYLKQANFWKVIE